ncbi:MAG: multicopper oxidase domain-containing protein [Planctomycetota bacterium]|nr:multicopper oxidase domain-containing protein [Planctomycetota bacterium]
MNPDKKQDAAPSASPCHGAAVENTGPSRRSLLAIIAGGFGLTATATARRALATPRALASPAAGTWDLTATPASTTFGDGATIPFFRYTPTAAGSLRGMLPYAEATEGTPMTVTVTNTLPVPIRPALLGVENGPWLRPGSTGSFTFNMPPAGTYLLGTAPRRRSAAPGIPGTADALRPTIGLSGTLVSRPTSGAQVLYDGGPAFDREYVLLYDDADDRQSALLASRGALPTEPYEANYFTLNGLGFPDTASDADTVVAAAQGERVLIRLGNLGRTRQAIHFHGFHCNIATFNNVPETNFGEKDTVQVATGTTTDVIFNANQLGIFPLHPHNVQAVTANGSYPFGQLTLIVVS